MKRKATITHWHDPDDAPALDRQWFDRAEIRQGETVLRPGRPRSSNPKRAVSLRLDPEVLDYFKQEGPGWQTRMNDALRRVAGL